MRVILPSQDAPGRNAAPTKIRDPASIADLRGSLVAVVTPFRNDRIDTAALAALCDRQVRRGSAALVVCGTTGEAATLTPAEQSLVIEVAVEAAADRVPVVAGCGALSTAASAELAASAARCGAAAILCAPPPYSKPTQDGIFAHVKAVAVASDLPVIVYDVASWIGVAVADETVARLYETCLIAGIKDAGGDLSRPPRLRALCGGELMQYSGDDATAAAHRAMGGHGCISVTANLVPALCAATHRAWEHGNLAEFGRLRDLLAPVHQAMFLETNPIPVKTSLFLAGLCGTELRLPLTFATDATLDKLEPVVIAAISAEEEAARVPRLTVVG